MGSEGSWAALDSKYAQPRSGEQTSDRPDWLSLIQYRM